MPRIIQGRLRAIQAAHPPWNAPFMPSPARASRRRFDAYRRELDRRRAGGKPAEPDAPPRTTHHRSFFRLAWQFLGLIRGQRGALLFGLIALTVSTLLKLVPPAVTKLVIDYVLTPQPLPEALARWLPADLGSGRLLMLLAGGVVILSVADTLLGIVGRWSATRATKRVQMALRRRVFDHAVRLPLHRVYQLKSGGVASILREDAGGVAELIFSMIYNPWRAVIQFAGSLIVLAWVDWRLLLGALVLVPLVYWTHRTWIGRIRPLHRDIRGQRQDIDSHATEAFGGMRVVRAFGRQRSEAGRFARGNHLMARQELLGWWWARGIELDRKSVV